MWITGYDSNKRFQKNYCWFFVNFFSVFLIQFRRSTSGSSLVKMFLINFFLKCKKELSKFRFLSFSIRSNLILSILSLVFFIFVCVFNHFAIGMVLVNFRRIEGSFAHLRDLFG